jgi:hypothetical protein
MNWFCVASESQSFFFWGGGGGVYEPNVKVAKFSGVFMLLKKF